MQMFDEIPDSLIAWIEKQQMFWVASAPLTADGLVNISPKGVEGTFHVDSSRRVWYEDLSGSGVETIAHIRENGRVTVLFNAFEGPPRIARLYGKGSVYEFGTPEYNAFLPEGTRNPGSRAAIVLDVFKVATTCGYAVPFYEFKAHRSQLLEWAAKKETADRNSELTLGYSSATTPRVQMGLKRWWEERNTKSLDGLQGVTSAHTSNDIFRWKPFQKMGRLEKRPLPASTTAPTGAVMPVLSTQITKEQRRQNDVRVVVAFLVGMLVTLSLQRLAFATQAVLVG